MSYLHKLARRLAVRSIVGVPWIILIASCQTAELKEGFAPPPPPGSGVVDIIITPRLGTLRVGDSLRLRAHGQTAAGDSVDTPVDWWADAGSITQSGLYVATTTGHHTVGARAQGQLTPADSAAITVDPPSPVAVILSPSAISLAPGTSQQFTASADFSDGSNGAVSVTYAATGGSITAGGRYTAGNTSGAFQVIATLQGGTLADTSSVTITAAPPPPPTLSQVILTPASVSLQSGGTQQFSVSGRMSDGSTSSVSVTYNATGGTITTGGRYTAGGVPGSFRVIATQQGGTLADTSSVTITAPTLSQVILTPASASLQTGATQQFSVSGRMSDGSTGSVSVTYSATGGTISAGGLYTAGTTTGSFQVIAAQQGGTLADTSSITITAPPPPPTLSQVILTPASASLQTGATQQFSVSGRMSDGSTSSVSVTYNATGGTITTGGLYTAGTTTGSFQVIAIQQGGTLADTSSVTITAAPPPGGGSGNITNCDFEAGNACGASPTSSSGTISFASSGCFAGTRCVDINVPASSSDGGSREDFDLGGARSDVWISFALKIITQPLSGLATQKMVIFRDVAASGANQFGEMNQIGGRWIWNWLFTDPNKGNIDLAAAPVGSWHTYKIHMTGNGFTLWMDGSSTPVKSLSTTAAVSGRPKQITLGGTLNGGSGASHFQFDNVHIGTSDPGWP